MAPAEHTLTHATIWEDGKTTQRFSFPRSHLGEIVHGNLLRSACRSASCGGLELSAGVHQRVRRKVAAVLPEVAPDPENAFERLADHARREGFEGDRPIVPGAHQCPEHGLQIDGARAQVSAVRVSGVEVAEMVGRLENGLAGSASSMFMW